MKKKGLSFRGAAPEEAVAVSPIPSCSGPSGASSPLAWSNHKDAQSIPPGAAAAATSPQQSSSSSPSKSSSWHRQLLLLPTKFFKDRPSSLFPTPLQRWVAKLERFVGGPRRLRILFLAFMALKSLFGLALLCFALRSYSTQDATPLPYRLAGNGAKATGLAIGVISGSDPAQRRRVGLLQETWATSLDANTDGLLVFSDRTDAAVPSVGVAGTEASWAGAQDRFFPALLFLHRAFPHAAWFVLVDDDTFLVPVNLKAALRKRGDAGKRWYIGRTMFVDPTGGRGTKEKEVGSSGGGGGTGSLLPFAHGGSGVCLSRGLVAAFVPLLEKELAAASSSSSVCRGTGYGDGDLALCLNKTLGIKVTHEPCLHSSGPWAHEAMTDAVLLGDVDKPCSFHQALRKEGDEGQGAGRADGAKDGQVWGWHRRYNQGEE